MRNSLVLVALLCVYVDCYNKPLCRKCKHFKPHKTWNRIKAEELGECGLYKDKLVKREIVPKREPSYIPVAIVVSPFVVILITYWLVFNM